MGRSRNEKSSKFIQCLVSFYFFLFYLGLADAPASINVPLVVTDYAGIARTDEPVTSGIPLPIDTNILSVDRLEIRDSDGKAVSAQFRVLSRWNGTPQDGSKPIKWVLLDFRANVSANNTTTYYLTDNGAGTIHGSDLSIDEDSDKIVVSTGKAKFQISKRHFNLFDYVWIDRDGVGPLDDPVVSTPGDGGLVLTDKFGKVFRSDYEPPEKIIVESSGPLHAVVNIRGVLKSQDGAYFGPSVCKTSQYPRFCQPYPHSFFYYNCRIHFFSGKENVKVFLTLENNGANGKTNPEQYFAPRQSVNFESLEMVLHANLSSNIQIESKDLSTQIGDSDSYSIYQDWKPGVTSFSDGIYYEANRNGVNLSSGTTYPGWLTVNDDSYGVDLAIRHFWQNFPKCLTVNGSELVVGLWPKEGSYPAGAETGTYLFDAGRHKTYEMALRFYSGAEGMNSGEEVSKLIEQPLMALASPEWYADSKALGMIAPNGVSNADATIDEALRRYEKLQSSNVYENDSTNRLTILNIKTLTPPHWEFTRQNRFFGWMNFGDLLWTSSTPCNLHYDWPHSMLLHYLRTGKRKFFDAGVEMVKHRYDIDQYHGDRTDTKNNHKYTNHFQFYESSGHADPALNPSNPSQIAPPTHTWNGGLSLYYLLTGDPNAWQAAEENVRGALNYFGPGGLRDAAGNNCTNDEIRYEGWSILLLLNAYRVSGNSIYLQVAKETAINRLLYREQQAGGNGHWGCDSYSGACAQARGSVACQTEGCSACTNTEWNTMFSYVIDPLIQIHYETKDEDLKQLLIRMADFSKNDFMVGGMSRADGKYNPLKTRYLWVEENHDPESTGGEVVKDIFFADLFAYVYELTGNTEYLDWAQKSFRDAVFYYGAPNGYIDPDYRTKTSFVDEKFPNSRTKIHGWLGRAGQVFLYTQNSPMSPSHPNIVDPIVPIGKVGEAYDFKFTVSGGAAPLVFSLTGPLPEGLASTQDGAIRGIPLEAGNFVFTIAVADGNSNADSKSYSLTIAPARTDSDGDGLSDEDETNLYGTDLNDPDTDGDGLNDHAEVLYWGENWNADVDDDVIINLLDKDSDNDGIPDGQEIEEGFDPADASSPPPVPPPTDGIRVDAVVDTTISAYSWNEKQMNFGGSGRLRIWSNGVRRILLKADVDGLPAGAVIQRAELKLYCYHLGWPSDPRLRAFRITDEWTEGDSDWGGAPDGATWYEYDYYDHNGSAVNNWKAPGGDIDPLVAEGTMKQGSWTALDITDTVRQWVAGEVVNHGLLLQAVKRGSNDALFYSTESPDQDFRPHVQIEFASNDLSLSPSSLPSGRVSVPYETYLTVSGGAARYEWIVDGLPDGLNWQIAGDDSIFISGSPSENGVFSVTARVQDSNGKSLTETIDLSIAAAAGVISITLQDAIEDTTVSGYSWSEERMNFGGSDRLRIWSNGIRRILVRADLSEVPTGAAVQRAELKLYCYHLGWPSDPRLQAFEITGGWKEGSSAWGYSPNGATWYENDYYDHNDSAVNNWEVPGGDIDQLVAKGTMQKSSWTVLDITDWVQKWVSGDVENYGLMLRAVKRGSNDALFYSTESSNENLRPMIEIDYVE